MRRDREKEKEYQKRYYEEHIKNNEEARLRKNAKQREYEKERVKTEEYSEKKKEYIKKTYMRYGIVLRVTDDARVIGLIEQEKKRVSAQRKP